MKYGVFVWDSEGRNAKPEHGGTSVSMCSRCQVNNADLGTVCVNCCLRNTCRVA